MTSLTDLQKELKAVKAKIKKFYVDCPDMDEKFFRDNVFPLCKEETRIEEEIEALKLLNVKVGTGMTFSCYTDRHACTVIKRTAKTITIQEDRAVRTDNNGMSDCQTYKYYRNKNGMTKTFRWSEKKGWVCGTYHCWLGRDEYYDFSF